MYPQIIAAIIAIWGIVVPFTLTPAPNINTYAYTYTSSEVCNIVIDSGLFPNLPESTQTSILLHEYGHCLGLGHYGSCNYNESIMGCATLGYVTDYDRAMLRVKVRGYVAGVASD